MKAGEDESAADDDLVARAQSSPTGDLRAFEVLVHRYQDKVIANCRFLTGSPADAQDLAQEVFVKAYFGLRGFERRSKFSTWLQRVKANHCLNFNEAARRRSFVGLQAPGVEQRKEMQVQAHGPAALIAREEQQVVREVLDSLNETLRIPLILRDMDGFAYQDIADQLGISLSAVKMRIKRAREEFRRLYESRVQRTDPASGGSAEKAEAGVEVR